MWLHFRFQLRCRGGTLDHPLRGPLDDALLRNRQVGERLANLVTHDAADRSDEADAGGCECGNPKEVHKPTTYLIHKAPVR